MNSYLRMCAFCGVALLAAAWSSSDPQWAKVAAFAGLLIGVGSNGWDDK